MVETRPSYDASRTVIAALRTMLYPRVGECLVTRLPRLYMMW